MVAKIPSFTLLSIFCILAHAYRSHQKTDHDRLWLKTRVSAQGRAFLINVKYVDFGTIQLQNRQN